MPTSRRLSGAYNSIQCYVRTWNASVTKIVRTQAFVPLSFAPGEVGQFDWSYEHVVLGGITQTIKLAHFRLTYSRQMFVVAYPRETQEMLFDAHNHAFAFFGEVPHKMVYDNLDVTLIHAPSSTKNASGERAPEMHQTKKGNQWYFGMKAHIGVDAHPGLVHHVEGTAANVADIVMVDKLLHGTETDVFGDAGFTGIHKRHEHKQHSVR